MSRDPERRPEPPTERRAPIATLLLVLAASCSGRAAPGATPQDRRDGASERAPDARAGAGAPIAEYVVEVLEDRRGVLWLGTLNRGVARYDGTRLSYLTSADGLCGDTIASIAEDRDGALWFAGHTGVCRYDGTFTRYFDAEGSVRTDRGGTVWVSTGRSVHRFDGTAFAAFELPLPEEPPSAYGIRPGRVTFQLEDARGRLWFATDGHGALCHDPAAGGSFARFTKQDGLSSDVVWSILEDRQGRVWFTCIQAYQPTPTGDGGVSRYDGKTFTTFPAVRGLDRNDVYTLYEDRSGRIWIGATGVGAYRLDGEEWTLFDRTDRPDLTARFGLQAMLEDRNGTLWCGFSGGLFRFDGSSFVHVTRDGPWDPRPAAAPTSAAPPASRTPR